MSRIVNSFCFYMHMLPVQGEMHEICVHHFLYLQVLWALRHGKHPSPFDLTTSCEFLSHTNTQTLSEEHIEIDLVFLQHDRK